MKYQNILDRRYISNNITVMNVELKLRIINSRGEPFLGPGPISLLREVEKRGSIHQAAKRMNMSYAKALRLVIGLEKNLRREVVIRHIGGRGGGGSELTPYARRLIRLYDTLLSKVQSFSKKEFNRSLVKKIQKRPRNGKQ